MTGEKSKREVVLEIFKTTGGGIIEGGNFIEVFLKETNPDIASVAVKKAMEAGLDPIVDCYSKRVGVWVD